VINVGAYSFEAGNVRHEHEWKAWHGAERAPHSRSIPVSPEAGSTKASRAKG